MKELRTEIEIQASPEKVWQILMDFDKWPEWNPFIHTVVGKPETGEKVDITFRTASKEMTLHCTIVKAEPNRELGWQYHVVMAGLFRGEHSFIIEPLGADRVRFVDREIFNGLLVPLQTKDMIPIQDEALKKWIEHSRVEQNKLEPYDLIGHSDCCRKSKTIPR